MINDNSEASNKEPVNGLLEMAKEINVVAVSPPENSLEAMQQFANSLLPKPKPLSSELESKWAGGMEADELQNREIHCYQNGPNNSCDLNENGDMNSEAMAPKIGIIKNGEEESSVEVDKIGECQGENVEEKGNGRQVNSENGSQEAESCLMGSTVDRLEKYSNGDIFYHRQLAVRSILETLPDVRNNVKEVERILDVTSRFSIDNEPSIRVDLVEQIPHIASYFINQVPCCPNAVNDRILPLFEQFLVDPNSQVRKVTHNSLIVMFEQGFISREFVEKKLCNILVQLMDFSNLDDFRIEAVATVSKIIRYLDMNLTERTFIQHFVRLCSDGSFHVRRVCASNFGEFCSVIGQEMSEKILLPQFKLLCEDIIWGVRKACADVFVPVSCICSNDAKRSILSPLFVSLLSDQSRWVKVAAFQALGPFISTFADPSRTGLYYNKGGVIVVDDIKDHDSYDSGCSLTENGTSPDIEDCDIVQNNIQVMRLENDRKRTSLDPNETSLVLNREESRFHVRLANENAFNNFLFWRLPIPELELDIGIVNGKATSVHVSAKIQGEEKKVFSSNMNVKVIHPFGNEQNDTNSIEVQSLSYSTVSGSQDDHLSKMINMSSEKATYCVSEKGIVKNENHDSIMNIMNPNLGEAEEFNLLNNLYKESVACLQLKGNSGSVGRYKVGMEQSIIPNDLLEHYLSMINPINYQTIDPELDHHCAYSLPAVALTLGRKYWPCLKETYEILSNDKEVKVRLTLAASLHQMSLILGPEYTSRDLVPVFLAFMKDIDEVRFGVLQNLAAILKSLKRTEQVGILPKIADFLKMENYRNWRFRDSLASQIIEIAQLYDCFQIKEHLIPIGLTLLRDKVSQVRMSAIRVLSILVKHMFCDNKSILDISKSFAIKKSVISDFNETLTKSNKWVFRHVYILLCEQLVVDNSLPISLFIDELLTPLTNLSKDSVPNVRLALARSISRTFSNIDLISSHPTLIETIKVLEEDKDSDVKQFIELLNANFTNLESTLANENHLEHSQSNNMLYTSKGELLFS